MGTKMIEIRAAKAKKMNIRVKDKDYEDQSSSTQEDKNYKVGQR